MRLLPAVALLAATAAGAQQAAQPAAAGTPAAAATPALPIPNVGDMAPDFDIKGATRYGVIKDAKKLSDYRGQTVVIAFFPMARTRGCTIQMEAYRDQYPALFNGGSKVVVLGMSTDADTTLSAWARESNFPFLFGSDMDQTVAKAYGSVRGKMAARNLFVVGPDGKISYRVVGFNVTSQDAYTELEKAIDSSAGAPSPR